MIPGTVSKLSEGALQSASKIYPKTDVVLLAGSTTINTIVPALGGRQSQLLILIPISAPITLGTSDNIYLGATIPLHRAAFLVYSRAAGGWAVNFFGAT